MKTLLSILSTIVLFIILTFLGNPENQIPFLNAVCKELLSIALWLLLFGGFYKFYELIFKD